MFIDTANIKLKAGDGGDGAVSFHREKYVANGGPDGGDGGKGGDILFAADDNLSTLADFRYKRKYVAVRGENGRSSNSSGKSAEPLTIRVPRGTVIKDADSGRVIADISSSEPQLIAKGGKGGWGNRHFATPTRQIPRFSKPGITGEELFVRLELKLLADVGLVGFPNVGKSTLVSVVSEAKPQIANYHFTTLIPSLGVVRLGEERSFVIADIPGIIEGAHEGVGLGHDFLRHIERCRLLIHMADVSGSEGRNPLEDFTVINRELREFNAELSERPMIVAGNKCDLATEEQIEEFKQFVESQGFEFYPIMAAIRHDVDPLINKAYEMLSNLPPVKIFESEKAPAAEFDGSGRKFDIRVEDGVYIVEADWLIPIMRVCDYEDYESLQYFQRVLISSGIIDGLREHGVSEGDTVSIYDFEFDFVN